MAYQTIEVSTKAFITTITLNRPKRLNALTLTLADELHEALHSHDQDDANRVFVITGAGRGFFAPEPTWIRAALGITVRPMRQPWRILRNRLSLPSTGWPWAVAAQ